MTYRVDGAVSKYTDNMQKDRDDDSSVTNTQFDDRNNLRYNMTRDMRKCFGMYVCEGDDVIAW